MKTTQKLTRPIRSSGFTLVEMVIVITIVSILAGSGIYMLTGFLDDAKYERVRGDLNTLDLAIQGFARGNYGKPPTQDQGLQALVTQPTTDPKPERWTQRLNDPKALIDPWGNPYQFRYPSTKSPKKYDLWSNGENGTEDTGEGGDDVGNW